LHLAHYILLNPSILSPDATPRFDLPPILELGAGTGFLSILLSQLGADVITTDLGDLCHPEEETKRTPLARLQANIATSEASEDELIQTIW
jgi:protein-L-isoaspartate O-methyltransferase